jgi:two-component system chemotaxis response regulator CheB
MKKKVRVLIIDDSAVVRAALSDVISSDPGLEVVGTAPDPLIAAQKIQRQAPDVITLDVEMPRMDGITFLGRLMSQHPIPVVICSSLTGEGSETALRALEYGAVDIITKPRLGAKEYLEESRIRICDAVRAASAAKLQRAQPSAPVAVPPKHTADVIMPRTLRRSSRAMVETTERVVVVGASTGGTEALRTLLCALPPDAPGMVIVQHMPEHFTSAFARRLDSLSALSVKEAADGDSVIRGRALIAPGNRHILLKRSGSRHYVTLRGGPLVCRHRPSVDVLFRSAALYAGGNAVGVIMTGMGDDGARGMKELSEAGAFTIAQDEATSVVYGMPHEAMKRGGVDAVLPLGSIAQEIVRACAAEEPEDARDRRNRHISRRKAGEGMQR